jgi:hypothetical protein
LDNAFKKLNKREITQQYFHCYATANDSRLYLKDIQNLMRIKDCYSGFSKIVLFIAISEVKKIGFLDRFFVRAVKRIFHGHPSVELREIFFKSNIGRDFSSYQTLFNRVSKIGNKDDFILFQNRSGYGPFHENWYSQFVAQFEKFDAIALCGSTINFRDNPARSSKVNLPHVQTYSFLTKLYYMNMLGDAFPGSNKTKKADIICEGEIELSQFFLKLNYKITCIEWPNKAISAQTKPFVLLDIKAKVRTNQFFYHRLYFRKNRIKSTGLIRSEIINWINFIKMGFTWGKVPIKE